MFALLAAAALLQTPNTLTPAETKAGWRLLFDGQSTKGWHNFRAEGVKPGWVVQDGALICADPHNGGDIVTDDKFDWFEMTWDYKLSVGGNSGVMFHVSDEGGATWFSGPEIQLHDQRPSSESHMTGWLYDIYDSKVDSTKPEGEWNHVRILITPKKCLTEVNGVVYYEYVLGSDDFKAHVAKSKFASMPNFAKLEKGTIALQGDHGVVSFRNLKLRPIQ